MKRVVLALLLSPALSACNAISPFPGGTNVSSSTVAPAIATATPTPVTQLPNAVPAALPGASTGGATRNIVSLP